MNIFTRIRDYMNNKKKYKGLTLMQTCMRKGKGIIRRMSDEEIIESLEDKYNYELSVFVDDLEITKIRVSNNTTKYNAYISAMGHQSVSSHLCKDGRKRAEIIDFIPGACLKLYSCPL